MKLNCFKCGKFMYISFINIYKTYYCQNCNIEININKKDLKKEKTIIKQKIKELKGK